MSAQGEFVSPKVILLDGMEYSRREVRKLKIDNLESYLQGDSRIHIPKIRLYLT